MPESSLLLQRELTLEKLGRDSHSTWKRSKCPKLFEKVWNIGWPPSNADWMNFNRWWPRHLHALIGVNPWESSRVVPECWQSWRKPKNFAKRIVAAADHVAARGPK